jgi:ATP-dependent Clp protease adaptor protein ClpS
MRPMPYLLNNPRPAKTGHDGPSANTSTTPVVEDETDVLTAHDNPFSLVVWNDEVNTFEWVIETLMEVCGHSLEQAEQCAMLIHTKGKYAVKRGSYDDLKPQCDAITERGIGATVEIMSES